MLDSAKLRQVLDYLCEDLGGDWLLTGGSLVCLVFDAQRKTEDIDLVSIAHPTLSTEERQNQLFQFVQKIGLGPEWVNSAVEPFVRSVPDWIDECKLIQEGARGRVYRPTLSLFIYLKLQRGSPVDIADIRAAVRVCDPAEKDEAKLKNWMSPEVWERYLRLRVL